ncbi:hypothetical protein [Faucicola atlantae]|uniref:Lipoprotein n=1 Tax=Faucicola atlantae TaxID=34059 RepID=A0A1B8QGM2_9GAMM|nr:hypothetical protein [Moraxella atlantae]OBX81211.1 hypothetical protein A9306_06670 [Moraxella atlantae]
MKFLHLISCAVVAIISGATGCATTPKPSYVSPTQYQNYDCGKLNIEYNRLMQYISTASSQHNGLTVSGVGLGIGIGRGGVYPNVNIGLGQTTGGNRNNLAIAMGEREAIVQAARMKNCAFVNGVKLYGER